MGRPRFEDFELRIGRGSGAAYTTCVVHSPAGEANGTFNLPFGPGRLEDIKTVVQLAMLRSRQRTRAALASELRELRTFGSELFDALFHGSIRAAYDSSRNLAFSRGKGLRLKLRIEPPELIDVPWEFIYERSARRFVALSARTPLVRYVELETPLPPLQLETPLHLLVLIASPSDYVPLEVEREMHRIRLALRELEQKGLVEIDFLPHATIPALQDRLREKPVNILHFIGHGGYLEERETGVLIFENEYGEGQRVRGEQLRHLLGDVLSLRLVLLNACDGGRGWDKARDPLKAYPGIAESLVHEGIAGVIANQFEVTDDAAIIFAREVYSAMADGFPIDAAVAEARKAIDLSLKNTVEWASPVLYSRTPDGLVFDIPDDASGHIGEAVATDVLGPEHVGQVAVTDNGSAGAELTQPAPEISSGHAGPAEPDQRPASLRIRFTLVSLGAVAAALILLLGLGAGGPPGRTPLVVAPSPIMTAATGSGFDTVTAVASTTESSSPTAASTSTATAAPTAMPSATIAISATSMPGALAGPTDEWRVAIVGGTEGYASYNLRRGPSVNCAAVGSVRAGEEVVAHGGWDATAEPQYASGWTWVEIELASGVRGWVWGVAVKPLPGQGPLPAVPDVDVMMCPPPTATAAPATRVRPTEPARSEPDDRDTEQSGRSSEEEQPSAPPPTATPEVVSTPTILTTNGVLRPPTPTPLPPDG